MHSVKQGTKGLNASVDSRQVVVLFAEGFERSTKGIH